MVLELSEADVDLIQSCLKKELVRVDYNLPLEDNLPLQAAAGAMKQAIEKLIGEIDRQVKN